MALTKVDDRGLTTPIDLQDNEKIRLGTGNDAELYFNGNQSVINSKTNNLLLFSDTAIQISSTAGSKYFLGQSGAAKLYYSDSQKLYTANSGVGFIGNIYLTDSSNTNNGRVVLGATSDLQIYHDGTQSVIKNATGNLDIITGSTSIDLQGNDGSETLAKFIPNGAVELYYDNSKKLNTTSTGATVVSNAADITLYSGTVSSSGGGQVSFKNVDGNGQPRDVVRIKGDTSGNGGYGELTLQTAFNNTLNDRLVIKQDGNVQIPADSAKLQIGAGQDLELYHDGTYSRINATSSPIIVRTNMFHINNAANNESLFKATDGGAVELYYDNSKKLETTSTGVTVTGKITATDEIICQDDIRIQNDYPRLYLTDTDNNDDFSLINNNGSFLIHNDTQGSWRLKIDGTTGQCNMNLRPVSDSTFNIGTDTLRWANVYADTYYGDGSNLTGMFVTGMIMLWSGASNAIPTGWVLCNGSNSTPDLRDRFVVGAGGNYSVGATGGADSVTLTTAQIPSHNHNLLYNSGSFGGSSGAVTPRGSNTPTTPGITDRISNTGGGQSHENRPPYYALCYIMKT